MPIINSQITEDSEQADGRRWISEQHNDTTGSVWPVTYLAASNTDELAVMNARVPSVNDRLVDSEISTFLSNIEIGNPVLGLTYPETTTLQRFDALHEWGKEKIRAGDFQAMRYLPDTLSQVTDTQLDNLVGETVRIKIRSWSEKIVVMNTAGSEMEV